MHSPGSYHSLGGNSALIVMEDADLNQAINAAVFSRFADQGQVCMCSNRILVQRRVYDQFVERYVNRVSKLEVGDPPDPQTDVGPLISNAQVPGIFPGRSRRELMRARDPCCVGRSRAIWFRPLSSLMFFPTCRWPKLNCSVPQCAMPFDTPEDALRIANDTPFGLSGANHTRDVEEGAEMAKQIDSGMIHVNEGTI